MAKPESNYVIVKCSSEAEAKDVLAKIVDEFPESSIWPYIAFDDGFGHFVGDADAVNKPS